jgi:SPP1 gp7 family putative phage head morphogenesis protein
MAQSNFKPNPPPTGGTVTVSALLFGAHRVTGDVHKTVYASGEPVPHALHNGLSQLEHAVEMDAAEYVRATIHKLIEDLKRADATAHMQMDDIYTEPSKRPDAQTAEETPPEPDETGAQVRAREKFMGLARWAKEGDLSDAGLAETDGLQTPEQGTKKRRRKADEKTLAERINDCIVNGGRVSAELSASLTTSRLITLGFLSQASSQGVIRYRVDEVLDDRTCPVCAMMHGKVFNVADQMARTVQALSTGDPQHLKVLAPWPSQSAENVARMQGMSNSDLQSAGLGAPPYHAGCRGLLAEIGEDAEDFSAQAMDLAQDIIEGAGSSAAEDEITPAAPEGAAEWSDADKDKLSWQRFDVTDPEAFAAVDDAYQAGDYELAQSMIDEWKANQVEKGEDNVPPSDDEGFEGPNQPNKKRKLQTP